MPEEEEEEDDADGMDELEEKDSIDNDEISTKIRDSNTVERANPPLERTKINKIKFDDTSDQKTLAITSKLYSNALIPLSKLSTWRKVHMNGIKAGSKSTITPATTKAVLIPPPGQIPIDAPCLCTRVLQIVILSSHQNGRDTHVRQIKIIGPRQQRPQAGPTFNESINPFPLTEPLMLIR
jgi:hypothetical protein